MANEYTAEDGLNVLEYLGIKNITEKEKQVFKEKWGEFYNGDLIGATWTLYSEALPFICGDRDRGSFMVAQLRDSDFGKRLETTGLDKELKEGKSLSEILKKGPHKFIKKVKVSDLLDGKINPYSAH